MPKDKVLVERETAGWMPCPLNVTDCGFCGALSEICRLADTEPRLEGANVTEILQLVPAGKVDGEKGQVLCSANCQVLVLICEIASDTEPVFETVTLFAEDVTPTGCDPKSNVVGARVI